MGLIKESLSDLKAKKDMLTQDFLEDLYFNKKMTHKEIAQHLNISVQTIARRMKKFKIATRGKTNSKSICRKSLDIQTIIDRYNNGETQAEIGKDYGFTSTSIWLLLREHGIKSRRRGRQALDLNKIVDLDKVRQMRAEGKSLKVIANFFDVPESTIYVHVRKHNIPTKKPSTLKTTSVSEVMRLYQSGLTMQDLAKRFNVSASSVVLYFKKHKLPSRNPKKRFVFSTEQLEIIQGLLDQGFSCRKIAIKMKIPYLKLIKLVNKSVKKESK